MTETIMKTIICCSDHDHATDPSCVVGAKEATIPMSAEEIAANAAIEAEAEAKYAAAEAAAEALSVLKASAKAKLIAGTPLTEEEAATIVF